MIEENYFQKIDRLREEINTSVMIANLVINMRRDPALQLKVAIVYMEHLLNNPEEDRDVVFKVSGQGKCPANIPNV